MLEIGNVTWVNHRPIATWLAQLRVCLEECAIAALEQVTFGVEQCRIAVAMNVSILVA